VIGGVLAQTLGYHSIFWFLAIFGGIVTILLFIFLPETLPSVVGNGSVLPAKPYLSLAQLLTSRRRVEDNGDAEKKKQTALEKQIAWEGSKPPRRKLSFLAPYKYLMEWDIFLICIMYGINYGAYYGITSSQPQLFSDIYKLTELQIGLTFIPSGVGCLLGTVAGGNIVDRHYRHYATLEEAKKVNRPTDSEKGREAQGLGDAENGGEVDQMGIDAPTTSQAVPKPGIRKAAPPLHFPIEKARLRALPAYLAVYAASFVAYGWVVQERVHLAAPLVLQFIIGYCSTSIFGNLNTLLVDLCPGSSASVTASVSLIALLLLFRFKARLICPWCS